MIAAVVAISDRLFDLFVQFQGGVIISVDSRATQGPYIGTSSIHA